MLKCKTCETELKGRQKMYCSRSCKAKNEGTKHMQGKQKSRNVITKRCEHCGDLVPKRNSRRFCSRKCYLDWWSNEMKGNEHSKGAVRTEEWKQKLSERVSGENNPMYGVTGEEHPGWKDEKRDGTWISKPTRIRIKDRDKVCKRCSTKDGLDIHHIEPWDDSHDSSEENLILLCRQCHSDCHRRYQKQSIYKDMTDIEIREFKNYLRSLIKEDKHDNN